MSLVSFGLRVALIKMLRGATIAGAEVYDSPIDPVSAAVSAAAPLIHIYSENEAVQLDSTRQLLEGKRTANVTVQMFLPVDASITVAGKPLSISGRKGGGQFLLDLIVRQVEAALLSSPSPWRELWNLLVDGYVNVTARPYVIQTDKGVRLAARELEFTITTQNDPSFGAEIAPTWQLLLDLVAADPDLKPSAPILMSAITGDAALTDSQVEAALLGYSASEMAAAGMGDLVDSVNDDPAETSLVDVPCHPSAPAPDGYAVA